MKNKAIGKALSEARRFEKAAKAYLKRDETDEFAKYGCAESAAVRRASMDLTRALAELRKS